MEDDVKTKMKLLASIKKKYSVEHLQRIINEMSIVAWGNRMERSHLTRWLKNFNGRILEDDNLEKILALWILMNFTFYSEREVRSMCRCIYEDYIHNKLLDFEASDFMMDKPLDNRVQYIIESTLFLPLGNPSESGTSILYFFRQENELSRESFSYNEKKNYENIVYIDDVTLSGTQANIYLSQNHISAKNKYLLTFITADEAIDFLNKKQKDIKLIYAILLDARSKCFSDSTFVFSGSMGMALKELAYKMCLEYGEMLFPGNPLGYGNGQHLFGFYYNTPDNTLPIIWSNQNGWEPAFYRHHKKYKGSEVMVNESKYL